MARAIEVVLKNEKEKYSIIGTISDVWCSRNFAIVFCKGTVMI